LVCILVVFAYGISETKSVSTADFVESINSQSTTWKSGLTSQIGWTDSEIKSHLGYRINTTARELIKKQIPNLHKSRSSHPVFLLPSTFDARTKWPQCLHPIRNQGNCGSCWAFGATESLTDRFCISSNDSINVILSVQETTSCTDFGVEGCDGGDPISAFTYTSDEGLPLDSCVPYTSGNTGDTGTCRSTCVNSKQPYNPVYYSELMSLRWFLSVRDIQEDIYTNGPVEACFSVYADFMTYTSGVYIYTSGSYEGGHCIKLLGWGSLNGVDYWLAANSWGTDWGMDGYFMIQRGVDMCGIEDAVFSVLPDISGRK